MMTPEAFWQSVTVRVTCCCFAVLLPQLVIVLALSFLQTRARRLPLDHRLPFLEGRFGVVV